MLPKVSSNTFGILAAFLMPSVPIPSMWDELVLHCNNLLTDLS